MGVERRVGGFIAEDGQSCSATVEIQRCVVRARYRDGYRYSVHGGNGRLVAGERVAGSVAVLLSHTDPLAGRRCNCRRRSGGLVERSRAREHAGRVL